MSSTDQYLKVIYALEQSHDEDAFIATGAVADTLDVHPSSATEMFAKLAAQELVCYEKYKGVRLTDSGRERGRSLLEHSCIVQRFLRDVLDVDNYRDEARTIEPVLDSDVAERLLLLVDRPQECPNCFDEESNQCRHLDD